MYTKTQTTKTAVELFEAGYSDVINYQGRAVNVYDDEMWLPPTLDQLIDASGDHFGMLQRKIGRHQWLVTPKNEHKDFVTYGPTAWEATAKFWLGLRYAQVL